MSAPRTSKGRMEAFSDGVMAIAITLLVLDLSIDPPGSPLDQLFHGWPTYAAFLVSFLTIGASWLDHNALTDRLDGVDPIFLRVNLLFLMLLVFLPFPTALVARSLHESLGPERVSTVLYGLTLVAIQLVFHLMDRYTRTRGMAEGEAEPDLQAERRGFAWAMGAYALTIVVALVEPAVSVVLYLAIAIFLLVPLDGWTSPRTST